MKEVLALAFLTTGCGVHSKSMQLCYAEADADFWAVVEECKAKRLKYNECAPLRAAEERHKEAQKKCR